MRFLLQHQAHVQIGQAAGVDAVCCQNVAAFADDAVRDLCRCVGVALVPGVEHFDSVYVEYRVVIVAVCQINVLAVQVLIYFHFAAQPDLLGEPGSPGCRVLQRAESGGAFFPSARVVILGIPLSGGLGVCVVSFPRQLSGGTHQGAQFYFFLAEEAVYSAVHLQSADQREFSTGPVLYGAVVEMVVHAPRACVWIN